MDISPYRGSEAAVAWNYVARMSQRFKIQVIYGRGKDEIDKYLAENGLLENVEFNYIPFDVPMDLPPGLKGDIIYNRAYNQWHKQAYNMVKSMVDDGRVQLIHLLNLIGFKEPGYAWREQRVPYVWGPLAGVHNRPLGVMRAMGVKMLIKALIRRVLHNGAFVFMPRVRKAFRRADALFGATPTTVNQIRRWYHKEAIHMPENGIMTMNTVDPIMYDGSKPLEMIWVGRVNDKMKGLDLLLDALLKTKSRNWHLHVVGKGEIDSPMAQRITSIRPNITWHGLLPRQEVLKLYGNAHLHVISSLGEANTTVIWEAMSSAVPTLSLDHCGMSGTIDESCGIKIPLGSYKSVIDKIAAEIDDLIAQPQRIEAMSRGVIKAADKYMWDNRIDMFAQTYEKLIREYETKDKQ